MARASFISCRRADGAALYQSEPGTGALPATVRRFKRVAPPGAVFVCRDRFISAGASGGRRRRLFGLCFGRGFVVLVGEGLVANRWCRRKRGEPLQKSQRFAPPTQHQRDVRGVSLEVLGRPTMRPSSLQQVLACLSEQFLVLLLRNHDAINKHSCTERQQESARLHLPS